MPWNASTLHLFISSLRTTCTRTGPPTGQTRSAAKVVKTLDQCQQSVLHLRAEKVCGIMSSTQKYTKSFQSLDALILCKEVFRRNLLTEQCKCATLLNARDKWQAFLEGSGYIPHSQTNFLKDWITVSFMAAAVFDLSLKGATGHNF